MSLIRGAQIKLNNYHTQSIQSECKKWQKIDHTLEGLRNWETPGTLTSQLPDLVFNAITNPLRERKRAFTKAAIHSLQVLRPIRSQGPVDSHGCYVINQKSIHKSHLETSRLRHFGIAISKTIQATRPLNPLSSATKIAFFMRNPEAYSNYQRKRLEHKLFLTDHSELSKSQHRSFQRIANSYLFNDLNSFRSSASMFKFLQGDRHSALLLNINSTESSDPISSSLIDGKEQEMVDYLRSDPNIHHAFKFRFGLGLIRVVVHKIFGWSTDLSRSKDADPLPLFPLSKIPMRNPLAEDIERICQQHLTVVLFSLAFKSKFAALCALKRTMKQKVYGLNYDSVAYREKVKNLRVALSKFAGLYAKNEQDVFYQRAQEIYTEYYSRIPEDRRGNLSDKLDSEIISETAAIFEPKNGDHFLINKILMERKKKLDQGLSNNTTLREIEDEHGFTLKEALKKLKDLRKKVYPVENYHTEKDRKILRKQAKQNHAFQIMTGMMVYKASSWLARKSL